MTQLELDWNSPGSLESALARRIGRPVSLTLTNNRSTMVSARENRATGMLELRVHRMFAAAPPPVVDALADWLRGSRSKRAADMVDRFIAEHRHALPRPRTATVRLCTRGAVHDLARIYAAVNTTDFDGAVDCPITWGKLPTVRRRRSIRLGSYVPEYHLIRIHPLLDQPFVPEWFVAFIVFHEMLHAHLGIETTPSGRRRIHSPAFVARERAHPNFARATAWLDNPANLKRLLGPVPRDTRAVFD